MFLDCSGVWGRGGVNPEVRGGGLDLQVASLVVIEFRAYRIYKLDVFVYQEVPHSAAKEVTCAFMSVYVQMSAAQYSSMRDAMSEQLVASWLPDTGLPS